MRWVRDSGRFGSWLALAALTLQLILSFGHVHLDGIHPAAPSLATSGSHGAAAAQAFRHHPTQSPGDDADDYCAICASIFLVSTSFVPDAPQLPLPAGFERVEHSVGVTFGLNIEPRRLAFQSRAPPLA